MKSKQLLVVFVVIVLGCSLLACAQRGEEPVRMKKLRVVTTLFPLYDMAGSIGADKVEVSLLVPPGVETHSFEPKPSDMLKVDGADIFVYTGKFMEPWAEDVIKGTVNKNLLVVDASNGTKMSPGVSHHAGEPAVSLDPHIWLDFGNAGIMAKNILQAFRIKDSVNTALYEQKAGEYSRKLIELDSSYKTTLAACKSRTIVYGGHYAFGYLAGRYGLKYLAAQGVSPDAEPTAKDLIRLVEQIRKERIKYIFYEELTSPRISETIAGETHAEMLLLNAGHNVSRDQLDQGVSFFDILRRNLENLSKGLECR